MTFKIAAREFNSGNFQNAERLCRETLANNPNHPEAMNLMGALAGRAGRHDLAAQWIGNAVLLNPRNPDYRQNHITALISVKRLEDAATAIENSLQAFPGDGQLMTLRGVVRARQGDAEGALRALNAALEIAPNLTLAHFNLAEVLRRQGEDEKALVHLKKSIELDSNNPDALNNMAGMLLDRGEFLESLKYLQRLLAISPRSAQGYCNLSVAMGAAGDVRQSLVCLRNALKIDPSLKDPRFKLINLLTSTGDFEEADKLLSEWETQEPGDARLLAVRVRMLERRGELAAARETFERIAEEDRQLTPVRVTEAMLLDVEGKPAEAAAALEEVISENAGDALDLVGMRFSLGKYYDQLGHYESAFSNYDEGNKQRRKGFGMAFEPEKCTKSREIVIKTLSEEWQRWPADSGYASHAPIFIVGMPRSGTSLMEQILAAHSQVHAAGELQAFSRLVRNTHDPDAEQESLNGKFEIIENDAEGVQSPVIPANFEQVTIKNIGREYVDYVTSLAEGQAHVSDKMPYNYLFVPLIKMALPNAKIIHMRRNPIDTCLSCYFQNFTGGSEYSFNLEHLPFYYQSYLDTMQAWRDLGIEMHEVHYEELVSDTEPQVEKILEFCGLEFEAACLATHKNKRAVATASYQQVRQPIYQKSVDRWRCYEPWIEPLMPLLANTQD